MDPISAATAFINPIAAPLSLVMSVFGGISQMKAAAAARRQSELDAYNVITQGVMARAEAKERSNARAEQWRSNEAQNIAMFSAMGRDVSNSQTVSSFLERQKEVAGKDIATSDFMGYMEQMKMRQEAGRVISEGKAAHFAGIVGGLTTIANGLSDYSNIKTN